MHLFGFITRIYHDARSHGRQILQIKHREWQSCPSDNLEMQDKQFKLHIHISKPNMNLTCQVILHQCPK